MKFSTLPQTTSMLKFMPYPLRMVSVQRRELWFGDFIEYTFTIGLCLDTFFQTWHVIVLDQILHFDSSMNYLYLRSRSQGYEKARTCAIILMESGVKKPKFFAVVNYVKKMTAKQSHKYGKYELFKQLLFLLFLALILEGSSLVGMLLN